jgi:hypothetical protein
LRGLFRLGALILVLGTGPLLAYIVFGPKDGNPVGLGLLFFFTAPFAAALFLAGAGVKVLAKLRGENGAPLAPRPRSGRGAGSGRGSEGHWP